MIEEVEKLKEASAFMEFCYKVMPFGLKNARTTYRRMITKIFEPLMGKIIDAYVDDMVFKSK